MMKTVASTALRLTIWSIISEMKKYVSTISAHCVCVGYSGTFWEGEGGERETLRLSNIVPLWLSAVCRPLCTDQQRLGEFSSSPSRQRVPSLPAQHEEYVCLTSST